MPIFGFGCEFENLSPLIRAWTQHYIAKGCHPIKAESVARNRVHRKRTWPPGFK